MLNLFTPYIKPIITAVVCFPIIAIFFTLPYAIINYKKFGGVSLIKTLIFFLFILYCICAYFLVILPLPKISVVESSPIIHINWIPFSNFIKEIKRLGLLNSFTSFFNIKVWVKYFFSSAFFQIVANIIMLVPLGFYLRYFFNVNRNKTILICFLVSLFFEITQLTGLYFIYPHPYRCPDINDLMTNTLGGYIGYLITPLLEKILPSKQTLDYLSWKKGESVTFFKQLTAEMIDWCVISFIYMIINLIYNYIINEKLMFNFKINTVSLIPILYFIIIQYLLKGVTIGKLFLGIKLVSNKDGISNPSFICYIIRFFIIYTILPLFILLDIFVVSSFVISIFTDIGIFLRILFIIAVLFMTIITILIVSKAYKNNKQIPHDYYSKTMIIVTKRPVLRTK